MTDTTPASEAPERGLHGAAAALSMALAEEGDEEGAAIVVALINAHTTLLAERDAERAARLKAEERARVAEGERLTPEQRDLTVWGLLCLARGQTPSPRERARLAVLVVELQSGATASGDAPPQDPAPEGASERRG